MARYDRRKVWTSEILYSADLNAEFDAVRASVNNIDAEQIVNGAVTTAKIADHGVTTEKIANGGVTNANLADEAVGPGKLGVGAVQKKNVGDGQIISGKIEMFVHEFTLGAGKTDRFEHGLTDEDGNKRIPRGGTYVRVDDGLHPWSGPYGVDLPALYVPGSGTLRFNWDDTYVYVKNAASGSRTFRIWIW